MSRAWVTGNYIITLILSYYIQDVNHGARTQSKLGNCSESCVIVHCLDSLYNVTIN